MSPAFRRFLALLAPAVVTVVAPASAAAAHATFAGAPGAIAAGTEVALTMDVPHERDESTYNVEVVVAMAAGWTVRSCATKATWTCRADSVDSRPVVRFVKDAGAAPAEDETFRFTLGAPPAAGAFAFPTLQTYNTGEIVRWIGAAGSAEPAPVLQVTGSAPVTTAAPVASAPPPTTAVPVTSAAPATPTTSIAPATTVAGGAVPSTSAAASTTVASVGAPSGAAGVGTPTISPTSTSSSATDGTDSGGGVGAAVAIGAIVLVVVAGGATVVLRRRGRAGV